MKNISTGINRQDFYIKKEYYSRQIKLLFSIIIFASVLLNILSETFALYANLFGWFLLIWMGKKIFTGNTPIANRSKKITIWLYVSAFLFGLASVKNIL